MDTRTRVRTIDEAREQLPAWDLWPTGSSCTVLVYSAKPHGADQAIPGCSALPDLNDVVAAARSYEAAVDEHIAETEEALAGVLDEPSLIGRRRMLESRLSALRVMAERRTRALGALERRYPQ